MLIMRGHEPAFADATGIQVNEILETRVVEDELHPALDLGRESVVDAQRRRGAARSRLPRLYPCLQRHRKHAARVGLCHWAAGCISRAVQVEEMLMMMMVMVGRVGDQP